jgi:uncharacterized glyoxalase superfamily protein PhnB
MDDQTAFAAHAAFADALVAERFITLGGPLEGTRNVVLVVQAEDCSAVMDRLATDPWMQSGLLTVKDCWPWRIRLGSLRVAPSPEEPTLPANRSMPTHAVIPVIAYADVPEAVEWLCRVFGFVERLRIGSHRAQLAIGNGSVIVAARASTPAAWPSDARPLPAANLGQSVMVRVTDVDKHYERAGQAGARIVNSPADYPYGERQYTALDLAGHVWTFSQTIGDVDPAGWGGVLLVRT